MYFNKTILVTGANSLLGCNTISELLNSNYKIIGLVRSKAKYVGPIHPNLQLVVGDILNRKTLLKACKNCYAVVHTAALTDQSVLEYERYHRVNVEGTRNVIELAIQNEVKKFIYVSSANVFGYGNRQEPGTENKRIKFPFNKLNYAKSKLEGQLLLQCYKNKIEVISINPTFMIGPYDSKPSSGRIVLTGMRNRIIFCPPGGKNFVNVKDVVKGIVSSLQFGKSGESYLLSNENLSFKEFFSKLLKITNRNSLIIVLPPLIMKLIGIVGSMVRSLGISTELSFSNMHSLCIQNFYSNKKVKNAFKMSFQPINIGISEAIKWFNSMPDK
jgi:nucleoside-diphosphate-sugar epimerase